METDQTTQELGWAFLAPSLPATAQRLSVRLPLAGQKSVKRLFAYLLRPGTFGEGGHTQALHLNMRQRRRLSLSLSLSPFFMETKASGHVVL